MTKLQDITHFFFFFGTSAKLFHLGSEMFDSYRIVLWYCNTKVISDGLLVITTQKAKSFMLPLKKILLGEF